MLTYGSTFSGIGGLDLAVERVFGAVPLWHVEPDPYAAAVLRRHWPAVTNLQRVERIDGNTPRPDIICGGFPCQDISTAGKGAGLAGKRSGLWWELARAIGILRPRIVILENVAALLTRGLVDVIGELARLGFDAEWSTFRALDAGAPHKRRRTFVVAHRNSRGRGHYGQHGLRQHGQKRGHDADRRDGAPPWPPAPGDQGAWARWSGPQPGVRRGDYGPPRGLDARRRRASLRCLGNAVVPQQAEAAIRGLWERLVTAQAPQP